MPLLSIALLRFIDLDDTETGDCTHVSIVSEIEHTLPTEYGLRYTRNDRNFVVRYLDSDWEGDINDNKSTSGYLFKIGAISWKSKKQMGELCQLQRQNTLLFHWQFRNLYG